jgi:hypothetical protein
MYNYELRSLILTAGCQVLKIAYLRLWGDWLSTCCYVLVLVSRKVR